MGRMSKNAISASAEKDKNRAGEDSEERQMKRQNPARKWIKNETKDQIVQNRNVS